MREMTFLMPILNNKFVYSLHMKDVNDYFFQIAHIFSYDACFKCSIL